MAHLPSPDRFLQRLAVALLFALLLASGWQTPAPAAAAPSNSSLTDVFSALHLTPEPADYVVIVDTSASMTTDSRYQRVRDGLSQMVQALSPDDRVAVITFDAKPVLRRPLTPVGSNRPAVVASLPASPTGQATDIGQAISSGLDLMQRANLRGRAAILLFTDGLIDTAKTSPYATVTSPGWNGLQQRAAALQSSHDIAPLAIGLTSNTDAAVLKRVFANVTDVSSNDLGSYLGQVSTEVLKAAAISKLKGHLSNPVEASLSGLPATLQSGEAPATLLLHNSNPTIPVQVNDLGVRGDGASMTVRGMPRSLALQPNGTATVNVTVSFTHPSSSTISYQVTGSVTTPWQDVISHDLGLTWSAKLASSTGHIAQPAAAPTPLASSKPPVKSSSAAPLLIGGLLLLLVLALAVFLAVRLLRGAGGPPLTGTLSVLRNGRPVDERLLRGRTASFPLVDSAAAINLRGAKSREGQSGVKVVISAGKERASGTLFEGDRLEFSDLVVTYTTDRTRMLRLIGTD